MPFSAVEEAIRKDMAEVHNPPLYTAQKTAEILGRKLHAVGQIATKRGWAVYHLPSPFHKANCYAQSDVEEALTELDENGGRWPTAGAGSSGWSVRELQKRLEADHAAKLKARREEYMVRCPSFAKFSPDEQEAFVADVVDKDNAPPKLFGFRYDRPEFVTATQRLVVPGLRKQVMSCVDLYYATAINFRHLRPDITVQVIAEIITAAPKPTIKRR